MGTGVIAIRIQGFGEEWVNTHGISVGGVAGTITLAQMEELAADAPSGGYTPANTNPNDAGYPQQAGLIEALLGFQRLLLSNECQVIGFNLNDGATPGAGTGPFWSQGFSLPGLYDLSQANSAPLSIAWLIGRVPTSLGTRTGHLNLRGSLSKGGLEPGRRVGVQFINDVVRNERAAALATAITKSGLNQFFGTGNPGAIEYVIPVYGKKGSAQYGQVVNGHPIAALTSINPTSRQKPRGRRRSSVVA